MTTTARGKRGRPDLRPTPRTGSFAPVAPVPVPRPRGGTQEALFGPTPNPAPAAGEGVGLRAEGSTADVELIATVIRLALLPGYLLVGAGERVMRREDTHRDGATPVPSYEADTVAQLLDTGHLRIGGTHPLAHRSAVARLVLVPAATRHQLDRWTATGVIARPR